MRCGPASEQTHTGILPVLRNAVLQLELLLFATHLRCRLGTEVVRQRKEDFRAKRLQQCAPRFARQSGAQRANTLRSHYRNTFGLARKGKELFVARRVTFADRREHMIFVAKKHSRPKEASGLCLHLRHPANHGPLEVLLHERADGLSKAWIARHGKVKSDNVSLFDQVGKRGQGLTVAPIMIHFEIVHFFRRAESVAH